MTRAGLRGGSDDDVLLPGDRRDEGAFATLRRGLRMMPEFRRGLPATFALALMATAGRVVVPIAVQQVIDRGLSACGRTGHGHGHPARRCCARWSSSSPPSRSTG